MNPDASRERKILNEILARWVKPFYLQFLHGNLARLDGHEQSDFVALLQQELEQVNDSLIDLLLRGYWREQLTGAWFAGLKKRATFAPKLGELLLASRTCYAGQGYCFALARFAETESIGHLTHYLDIYLPRLNAEYDQDWVIGSLLWLDKRLGTEYAQPYLIPQGLWEGYAKGKSMIGFHRYDLKVIRDNWDKMMLFCETWFPVYG